ncbi:MAG: hypothetical protein AB1758_03680 [Candidatus Eremiobacterota bacterium]
MYTWDDSMEDWARPGAYRFDSARSEARARDASRARAAGPRTYAVSRPDEALTSPAKTIHSTSKNPLIIAVDVTGSMAHWPFEIFDRLPLLYNTLSQYRPDLEVCFAAIGDAHCDRWPLQVTTFSQGFNLESQLKAIYGEGGGGCEPESYELFAFWVNRHVRLVQTDEKPFLIVFGDAPMHPRVQPAQVRAVMGDRLDRERDAVDEWRSVAARFNTWFLRRKGTVGDRIDAQWSKALGQQNILHIDDEQRAVDYAMGLIARQWGRGEDFRLNMAARQTEAAIARVERDITRAVTRAMPTRRRTA